MKFGIMFFSSARRGDPKPYRLFEEAARFADRRGLDSLWIPERHFHEFGGLFPNPSVLAGALALITERISLRAGSLVSPLHHTLRIAEEWAVLDNLTGGRVGISFGSGWNVDDFVFFPDRYAERKAVMLEQIEQVRRLWRGEPYRTLNSFGRECEILLSPRPLQAELPLWVTSSGNPATFAEAAAIGANVLTHLLGQDLGTLAQKIEVYRSARARVGLDPEAGEVTVMLHTFMGEDSAQVRQRARSPFREYLRSAVSLEQLAAAAGGAISGGHTVEPHALTPEALDDLLDLAFERYAYSASLIGSPADLRQLVFDLSAVGVTEIACLIDFIDDFTEVMASLEHVARFAASFGAASGPANAAELAASFLDDLEAEGGGQS